jgi:cytochrome c oxidase subunit 2
MSSFFLNFIETSYNILKSTGAEIFYNFVGALDNSSALRISHAKNWQFGFQTPASPVAEGIIAFHDDLIVFLTLIFFFVCSILYTILDEFGFKKEAANNVESDHLVHASTLEIVWTIIPALILIVIAIPSFSLLYSVDEIVEPILTFKVIGHQWYWSYEFLSPETIRATWEKEFKEAGSIASDILFRYKHLAATGWQDKVELSGLSGSFDSYRLGDEELAAGEGLTNLRTLTVDNHLYFPVEAPLRVLISSADVLHSWAVPALGVKVDACPGRLNQTSRFIKRPGIYYGQCSEICGVNHGFIPIGIVAFQLATFPRGSALSHRVESVLATWGARSRE